jgi:dTDP-4-amino-4,6-dideoxygalactose transaminase
MPLARESHAGATTIEYAPVPFLDLVAIHAELEDELISSFSAIVRSGRFIGGPEVEGFEHEFASCCGTRHCIGVSSGTDALRFALIASDVGPGDSVVTVAHTFLATVEAIAQCGAETEFVDIDERSYTMSVASLAEYLDGCETDAQTGRPIGRRSGKPLKAVLPVHLYGQVADMDGLGALAERYGLVLIEDACQAHAAEYLSKRQGGHGEWRRAGALGKAAAFSFYPGKNLGAFGEAGAVTTDDDEIARRVRVIRDHGQSEKYYHEAFGYNGRLDALQAAILRIKLRRLLGWNAQRRQAADRYRELLEHADLGSMVPFEPTWTKGAYHLYVIRSNEREALAKHLASRGIGTGFHYPVPVHLQKCCADWQYGEGSLPVTERVAAEILSLPMGPSLTLEQQQRVIEEVRAFVSTRPARTL